MQVWLLEKYEDDDAGWMAVAVYKELEDAWNAGLVLEGRISVDLPPTTNVQTLISTIELHE